MAARLASRPRLPPCGFGASSSIGCGGSWIDCRGAGLGQTVSESVPSETDKRFF